ncbi:Thoeris anti-defense Tad2 family protein [Xenorhabdus sp. IM139775]|uniref:Thoeris anti-defense Tad2 family protein n=1 Tax=Xenorhabdus sp. IM139775 TaxID=3025876 RepID=UPI002358B4FE|nr:MW1434 family type I TA system toxin [Xenorhabdus sp. IM139775]MDC9594456.1 DUF2829 domain-containing protein [Xenorhabdus sp. IM139775]
MSEINKPENENSENKCQINPDQYQIKIDTVTAPVGSCPWAIIQAYLGNELHRNDWDTPNEYMRLASKEENNDFVHIEKSDKHGIWLPWQPSPEDLMACDWNLLQSEPKPKPDNYMLSFDIKVGDDVQPPPLPNAKTIPSYWGYNHEGISAKPFGILTNFQNETEEIGGISYFVWSEYIGVPPGFGSLFINVTSGDTPILDGYQKMVELFKKDLTVTVDSVAYHLGGTTGNGGYLAGPTNQYELETSYDNTDAKKLGLLLQQNVGNTLHFTFTWK